MLVAPATPAQEDFLAPPSDGCVCPSLLAAGFDLLLPATTVNSVNPRMSVDCQTVDARARVLAKSFLGDPFELRGHPKST